jgi:hypothetical protein
MMFALLCSSLDAIFAKKKTDLDAPRVAHPTPAEQQHVFTVVVPGQSASNLG